MHSDRSLVDDREGAHAFPALPSSAPQPVDAAPQPVVWRVCAPSILLIAIGLVGAAGVLAIPYQFSPILERRWLLALPFAGLGTATVTIAFALFSRAQAAASRRQCEQETVRARAEEALRRTERMLRTLLDFAPMPMYVVSSPGRFLAVNAAWEAATGIDRVTALARPCADLFAADIARQFEEGQRLAFDTGKLVHQEQSIELRGSVRHFDTVKFPICDDTGTVTAVAGVSVDVTERKRIEDDLRKESAQTKGLLRVAERLASTLDPASVLDTLCQETAHALSVEAVNIKLSREDGCLHHAASYGLPPEWIAGDTAVTLDQYLALAEPDGHALWPDVQQPGRTFCPDLYVRFDIRSAMGVLIAAGEQVLGTIAVYSRAKPRAFRPEDLDLLRGVASLAATALANARLFEQTRQQAERLRMLSARLSETEDRERARLARDLHDQVGQSLTALGVGLSLASLDLDEGTVSALHGRLAAAQDLLAETGTAIRNVLLDLRPPALDDHGLVAALQSTGDRLAANTGIRVVVEGTEPTPRMAARIAGVLYRIAQEALTNAVKHAEATSLLVTVAQTDNTITLIVADDGRGFDVARRVSGEGTSWGLLIMEERARTIGAQLRIDSAPGKGTRVTVEAHR